MRLDRFLAKSRIIDLKSSDFKGAIKELLNVCTINTPQKWNKAAILEELLEREQTITTNLGGGIGLPHIRLPMKGKSYVFAVGRCPNGLEYEGVKEYQDLRVIFLLLASDEEKSYLNVLASLARIFQDGISLDKMLHAGDLKSFQSQVMLAMGGSFTQLKHEENKFNHLIIKEAEKIAKGAHCSGIMIFADTFDECIDIQHFFTRQKVILVGQSVMDLDNNKDSNKNYSTIPVRLFSHNRLSQMRGAILLGLTRGIINSSDRLCCIGGLPKTNQFDTLMIVEVQKEFRSVLMDQSDILPASVQPEVLERVLMISTELAVEGREGRPVGAFFVLGDVDELEKFSKPLVLNPFYGYSEEDKNVLNPFMDETIKEFSCIDGAFIIKGDGVIHSAGSLIHAPDYYHQLPGGLGTRHSAGLAISLAADCLALVVSASTGQVTLFRRGQMLAILEKASGKNI